MTNDLIFNNILLLSLAAFFLGLDKGGFRNLSIICMYILLTFIPSKQVIGILAPILLFGDIIPIFMYKKEINMSAVKYFTPLALLGIILTSFFTSFIDDRLFTIFISFFLLLMAIIITVQEIQKYINRKKCTTCEDKPLNKPTALLLSFLSGVSTVSNSAGALTCIYFLKQTKEKREFVGSTALFFFSMNLVKVIIFAFFWKNITFDTLKITISMLPGLLIGLLSSTLLLKIIPQKIFNIIVILSVYYIIVMLFINNLL